MELIYHYTVGHSLEKILKDGKLIVSEFERKAKVKPPALWLSKNPVWEPTATKLINTPTGELRRLTKDEQHKEVGLYRFVLPFEKGRYCTWKRYRYKSNTPPRVYKSTEENGIERGANRDEWFVSFENIPLQKCLCCELWDGEAWHLHIDFKNQDSK